jgi:hypothetical protein
MTFCGRIFRRLVAAPSARRPVTIVGVLRETQAHTAIGSRDRSALPSGDRPPLLYSTVAKPFFHRSPGGAVDSVLVATCGAFHALKCRVNIFCLTVDFQRLLTGSRSRGEDVRLPSR